MSTRVTDDTGLAVLVRMAIKLCRAAQRQCPPRGPGRLPDYQHWQMAVLICAAVLKRRKTKSAQYRFVHEHRKLFMRWLNLKRFPTRSTYFVRYRQAHRLLRTAIGLQGRWAIAHGLADASVVAVDKSLMTAKGPRWNRKDRKVDHIPPRLRGVDRDSKWGYSMDGCKATAMK